MRKTTIAVLTALMMVATAVPALAQGPPDGKGPQAALEKNDSTWACGAPDDELPFADHCLNIRSAGKATTLNIKVFDSRGPQESGSAAPKADVRPCPHDGDADADGTWWWHAGAALYVCHHSGQQPSS